ncbi:MAG: glycine dehydrogenase, partial [Candidatus Omnitrophica bacterium]|nr:glycine dehydrogenase [Candidatus Omnitrophota bacterium]
ALMACVTMTLMGKSGIQELAQINMDRAYYLRGQIGKLQGFRVSMDAPIFNEFIVESVKPFSQIEKKLLKQKIIPGLDLSRFYPDKKNQFLVCATETKEKEDLDRFVEALSQC